jgi:hypothetical protein
MAPFLALITPVGGDTQPPQPPLGIWGPTDPRPTPPIANPGRPPWWGMANDPGYSPPWAQPRPPTDPGYSPPWAQVPPGGQGGGPVDPGYSPPWAQVPGGGKPPQGPVDPGYSPPWAQVPPGGQGPVDPGYSPPWAQVPGGGQPPVGPPNLPEGGGVIVPLPESVDAPEPPAGTPENHEPYVVWFGPGTVVSVVYLPPPATTKPPVPGQTPPGGPATPAAKK